MADARPLIAVTMGDPAGVGPEVSLKALADPAVHAIARCALVGPLATAVQTAAWLRLPIRPEPVSPEALRAWQGPANAAPLVDLPGADLSDLRPGALS